MKYLKFIIFLFFIVSCSVTKNNSVVNIAFNIKNYKNSIIINPDTISNVKKFIGDLWFAQDADRSTKFIIPYDFNTWSVNLNSKFGINVSTINKQFYVFDFKVNSINIIYFNKDSLSIWSDYSNYWNKQLNDDSVFSAINKYYSNFYNFNKTPRFLRFQIQLKQDDKFNRIFELLPSLIKGYIKFINQYHCDNNIDLKSTIKKYPLVLNLIIWIPPPDSISFKEPKKIKIIEPN